MVVFHLRRKCSATSDELSGAINTGRGIILERDAFKVNTY